MHSNSNLKKKTRAIHFIFYLKNIVASLEYRDLEDQDVIHNVQLRIPNFKLGKYLPEMHRQFLPVSSPIDSGDIIPGCYDGK